MKLVYPWDASAFNGTPADMDFVTAYLRRTGYQIDRVQAMQGSSYVVQGIDKIMKEELLDLRWVLAVSNSHRFLRDLATAIPVIYSLTTRMASNSVTTGKLYDLFRVPGPSSEFDPDPAGDELYNLERTSLLVWEDIVDTVQNSIRMSGKYTAFLRKRVVLKKATCLFTSLYSGSWNEAAYEGIKGGLQNAIGSTAAGIIIENAVLINFHHKQETPKVKTVNIG